MGSHLNPFPEIRKFHETWTPPEAKWSKFFVLAGNPLTEARFFDISYSFVLLSHFLWDLQGIFNFICMRPALGFRLFFLHISICLSCVFPDFHLFCICFLRITWLSEFQVLYSGSKKYFKECFAPHHRLSSQTVAFDIKAQEWLAVVGGGSWWLVVSVFFLSEPFIMVRS